MATRYRDGGDEYDVRVQLHQDNRELVEQLPQLPVVTASGDVVPLGALARIDERTGPTSINRRDQERFLRVTAGFSGRPFSEVVRVSDAKRSSVAETWRWKAWKLATDGSSKRAETTMRPHGRAAFLKRWGALCWRDVGGRWEYDALGDPDAR